MRALVIGAGVIGLSTGIRLLEHDFDVEVRADRFSPDTTSDVAAAIWYPYKALPEKLVQAWGESTLRTLQSLVADPMTGVRICRGKKYFHRPMGNPWWRHAATYFERSRPEDVPPGILAGYEIELPLIDMSLYMPYLLQRFLKSGGKARTARVTSLDSIDGDWDIVVNCTGLGAKDLLEDPELFPIRGQTVRVGPLKRETFLLDSDNPKGMVYVISRANETILGGIADDHDSRLEELADTTSAIYERCCESMPELKSLPRLGTKVGLRPGRSSIRLQEENIATKYRLFHNYGHGGSGVTLSWGCADAIVALVREPGIPAQRE
jgi:D-amino-acid oxidase